MTGSELFNSPAVTWQELADDLLSAIDRLEAINSNAKMTSIHPAILITVADDLQSLTLSRHFADESEADAGDQTLRMCFPSLPTVTDIARDDEAAVPNASIDRAISKAAAEMLTWTKDPESFELIEHQRYRLFLQWSDGEQTAVDEYAYGLWDE